MKSLPEMPKTSYKNDHGTNAGGITLEKRKTWQFMSFIACTAETSKEKM
jgi:hypothetical protein